MVDPNQFQFDSNTTIGGYRILHRIGRGGMAEVHLGFHKRLKRHAAIKILRPELVGSEEHRSRFVQEAQSAASLIHPNIVQVYDVGEEEQYHFIAQEYVPGSNLATYIRRVKTLPLEEALSILLQAASALEKSAAGGVVHRDIKPENILLTPDGEAKIADFGLARLAQSADQGKTKVGFTMGTPLYMSPEQLQGNEVDCRSDLYSLGVTAYQMLTGQTPFSSDEPITLALQHVQNSPPPLADWRDDLPPQVHAVVEKLLNKDPDKRFQTPVELHDELERICQQLSGDWKGRTVRPLPALEIDAEHLVSAETIRLQTAMTLARQRQRRITKLKWAGLTSLIALPFVVFGVIVFWPREPVIQRPIIQTKEISERESVEEQYFAALKEGRPADWAAITEYFADQAEQTDAELLHVASLRQSRALANERDFEAAKQIVDDLLQEPALSKLMRVLAFLELAKIELQSTSSSGGSDLPISLIAEARTYYESLPKNRQDIVLAQMPGSVKVLWNNLPTQSQ